jgi:P27 family predicted phage terminase small subunit
LKIVEGTRDRRPWALQACEPVPSKDLEQPPEFLSEGQRAIWALAISKTPLGLLKEIDAAAFAAWVACYDRFQHANQALKNSPMVIRGSSGSPMQSPWTKIVRQESLLLRTLSSELGFSPVSRTRIALEVPVEDDDPMGYFK